MCENMVVVLPKKAYRKTLNRSKVWRDISKEEALEKGEEPENPAFFTPSKS